ncbi:hypothetical protein GGF31_006240, partial [Allomyces arbusculus]
LSSITISANALVPPQDDDLLHLIAQLPASLMHLTLSCIPLGGTPMVSVLASHMPPRLEVLGVPQCQLDHADLAVLAAQWPATLRELNLRDNATIPGFHWKSKLLDATRVAWTEALPPALRVLNVAGMHVTDGMVAGMLESVRNVKSRKMAAITIQARYVSEAALVHLRRSFDVTIVL